MRRRGTGATAGPTGIFPVKSAQLSRMARVNTRGGETSSPPAPPHETVVLERIVIADGNECEVCVNTRDGDGLAHGVDEDLYDHADQWRTWTGYSDAERVAAEFAYRFATEHTALRDDEAFWARCAEHFSDELLADLALSCALWVGMGRVLRTLDIAQSCKLTLPSRV